MAPVQQLIAAAFVLCGLLFLLHIDSVNSLRCKVCLDPSPACNGGNVPDIECPPDTTQCRLTILNSSMSSVVDTYRGCSGDGRDVRNYCESWSPTQTMCHIYCSTDRCN